MGVLRAVVVGMLLAPVAYGSDLPVTYSVQDKALKTAVAGTPFTFSLYSDAGCGSQVFTTNVKIENVSVVSRLKLVSPKGTAKPPPTDQLQTTLKGVTVGGNLYLKVTGAGVTPSGGVCQAQAGSVQADPSLSFVVKDANGAAVGVLARSDSVSVLMNLNGQAVAVPVFQGGFVEEAVQLFYTSADCTGQPLGYPDEYSFVRTGAYQSTTKTLYVVAATSTAQNAASGATIFSSITGPASCTMGSTYVPPDTCCFPFTGTQSPSYGSVTAIDVSRFVPPFHVE